MWNGSLIKLNSLYWQINLMIIQNNSTVLLRGKCFMIGIENKLFRVEAVRLIIF